MLRALPALLLPALAVAFAPTNSEESELECSMCVTLVDTINELLVPKLNDVLGKQRAALKAGKKFASKSSVGELDELAYEHLEKHGCLTGHIYNDVKMRKVCRRLLNDVHDEVTSTLVTWARGEHRGGAEPSIEDLRTLLCGKATDPPAPMRACTPEQLLHTEPIDPYAAHNKKTEKIKQRSRVTAGFLPLPRRPGSPAFIERPGSGVVG